MAQTTAAQVVHNGKIEYSLGGTGGPWVDISGIANKLTPGNSTRQTGEVNTADGDKPIVKGGKRNALDIDVMVIYTEGLSDAFKVLYDAHLADTPTIFRWSPAGGQASDLQFQCDEGVLSECTPPPVDPDQAGPFVCNVKLRTPGIDTPAVIAP